MKRREDLFYLGLAFIGHSPGGTSNHEFKFFDEYIDILKARYPEDHKNYEKAYRKLTDLDCEIAKKIMMQTPSQKKIWLQILRTLGEIDEK